jgi:hypothetical protein
LTLQESEVKKAIAFELAPFIKPLALLWLLKLIIDSCEKLQSVFALNLLKTVLQAA